MIKKYKCAVFDLDGTLLDTSEGIYSSVEYAVSANGLRKLKDEELHTFIGPPLSHSFSKYLGVPHETVRKLIEDYRYIYNRSEMYKAKPYDGIFKLLDALCESGIKTAVATYKPQETARTILRHFGFDKYIKLIFGADNNDVLKKHDIIETAIKAADITDKSEAVMIGDSDNDALGASNVGIDFIGVTYGFGFSCDEDIQKYRSIGSASSPMNVLPYLLA